MKRSPLAEEIAQPVPRVAMPCAPRLEATGGTVHVVARCNYRGFAVSTSADFDLLLAHLGEIVRTYDISLYAYTLECHL